MASFVRTTSCSWLAFALLSVATTAPAARATTAASPHPVSPGDRAAGAVAETRCPTFQWSGVPGARGYELAVYRAEEGVEPVLVASASVPGDARGWTPPMSQCLERGQRYAWTVAASGRRSEDARGWAPALLFEVATVPSGEELRQAMDTIQAYLRAEAPAEAIQAALPEPRRTVDASATGSQLAGRRAAANRGERARPTADETPGTHGAPDVIRTTSAGTYPAPGAASLSVSGQLHLADASHIFKNGAPFLWDNEADENTAFGRNALANNTDGAENGAFGSRALFNNTTGSRNVATGPDAMADNTTGANNAAFGFEALAKNIGGQLNTALGSVALGNNTTGNGNVAIGIAASYSSTSSANNTAVGSYALFGSSGGNNIALGQDAGRFNYAGNNSIFIGNSGSSADGGTTKIGTSGVQTTAFLAGDLGLGFDAASYSSLSNRLHVRESLSGANTPENHVAQIENTSTASSPDVLSLRVGRNHAVGTEIGQLIAFISFQDGDGTTLGFVRGNAAGGVEFGSAGSDFAEWLPRLDRGETIEPGDVVGLHGGAVSKLTIGATGVFVVSTAPLLVGNDPGSGREQDHALVALVGQAPIKVRGPVRAGDLLVASGRGDGVAVARAANELSMANAAVVVGRALEDAAGNHTRPVRALVGADGAGISANRIVARSLERLEQRLERLEARVAPADASSTEEVAPTRRR